MIIKTINMKKYSSEEMEIAVEIQKEMNPEGVENIENITTAMKVSTRLTPARLRFLEISVFPFCSSSFSLFFIIQDSMSDN